MCARKFARISEVTKQAKCLSKQIAAFFCTLLATDKKPLSDEGTKILNKTKMYEGLKFRYKKSKEPFTGIVKRGYEVTLNGWLRIVSENGVIYKINEIEILFE